MTSVPQVGRERHPSSALIRLQLERILGHPVFVRSDRMSSFLRYIVEKTLAGEEAGLKEQVFAYELYGRDSEFSSSVDPIVRVDARRLRDKLREYYAAAPGEQVIISLPKGTYVPAFEFTEPVLAMENRPESAERTFKRGWLLIPLTAIAALLVYIFAGKTNTPQTEYRQLTSLPGVETGPSLSPDGNFVAFAWIPPGEPPNQDVYVKAVHGEALRRLTDHPGSDSAPSWSPDGREIAFVRHDPPTHRDEGIYVVSALGGHERKIGNSGTHVGWTPDSKFVLVRDIDAQRRFAVFSIALDTLSKRQLTHPPEGIGDWRFDLSPDGSTLAFVRQGSFNIGDIWLMPFAGGAACRLTNWGREINSLVWKPDGREIVYGVEEGNGRTLWRIPASLSAPARGRRIADGLEGQLPSFSRPGRGQPVHLAFQVSNSAVGLRLVDLTARNTAGVLSAPARLCESTRVDTGGVLSADGERVAFWSNRGGPRNIWVANRDGSGLFQLSHFEEIQPNRLEWSPDGSRLAFDSVTSGNSGIWVIRADGGRPGKLTNGGAIDANPRWSRDGQSIYFWSTRAGGQEIWKMGLNGEHPVQITRGGGCEAQESPDGKSVYYTDRFSLSPEALNSGSRLVKMETATGRISQVLPRIWNSYWAVTDKGIVYVNFGARFDTVEMFSFSTQQIIPLGRLPFKVSRYLGTRAVSSWDAHWLLTSQTDHIDSDLMMIDNFR